MLIISSSAKYFNLSLVVVILFIQFKASGQKSFKANPIVFMEYIGGLSYGKAKGLTGAVELNGQVEKNLFTARYLASTHLVVGSQYFLPTLEQKSNLMELAVLYGLRFINKGHSYSFSGGVSYNSHNAEAVDADGRVNWLNSKYIGVPYELNVKWFKRSKHPIMLYGVIPVGPPTALGSSFGFKLFGNLSKKSFVGAGLVVGLGYHKEY